MQFDFRQLGVPQGRGPAHTGGFRSHSTYGWFPGNLRVHAWGEGAIEHTKLARGVGGNVKAQEGATPPVFTAVHGGSAPQGATPLTENFPKLPTQPGLIAPRVPVGQNNFRQPYFTKPSLSIRVPNKDAIHLEPAILITARLPRWAPQRVVVSF